MDRTELHNYNRGHWTLRCHGCGADIATADRGYAPGDGHIYCGEWCVEGAELDYHELAAWGPEPFSDDYGRYDKSIIARIREHMVGIKFTPAMADEYHALPLCLKRKHGLALDEAAAVLHDAGVIKDGWASTLVEAVYNDTRRARRERQARGY